MKTNSTDTRRVHTRVIIRNDERKEEVVWGDTRIVFVTLGPGEVPDMMNDGSWGKRTLFRPETVRLEWQRNTRWGHNAVGGGWKGALATKEWVLVGAYIRGTNVLKSGSLGKIYDTNALYANEDGYGVNKLTAAPPPEWFATLRDENDPNKTGSALDGERITDRA